MKKIKPPKKKFKGVELKLLHQHVKNAAPYLFHSEHQNDLFLKEISSYSVTDLEEREKNIESYFRVCMQAHWSTCGSFVPADVDNGIRLNLWKENLNANQLQSFFETTAESFSWNYHPVTAKIVTSSYGPISTHEGTWFAVAVAAYAKAVEVKNQTWAKKIFDMIWDEVKREESISLEVYKSGDTIKFLKLCALVAHNLGDLDRVFDMWKINDQDPLKLSVYKASQHKKENLSSIFHGIYWVNRMFMAPESHRHFIFRHLRPLRRNADLMLPFSPFLDSWGEKIVNHANLDEQEKGEILMGCLQGIEKMPKTSAYVRALSGILKASHGGLEVYYKILPEEKWTDLNVQLNRPEVQMDSLIFEQNMTKKVQEAMRGEFSTLFPSC